MPSDSAPLVVANLLLAAVVLVPVALVVASGVMHLFGARKRRSVMMVDIPGVGRIPVLRG